MHGSAPLIATGAFALYAAILLWIAISDLRHFRIPNLANASLFLLFVPTALLLSPEVDWLAHAGAALLVLVIAIGPFALGWFGAGDVKMFTALAFWSGFSLLVEMMFLVSLAGGGLALVLVLRRRLAPALRPSPDLPPDRGRPPVAGKGGKMPYGAAISAGALVLGFRLPQFAPLFG